jgi:fluoride exporter
MDRYAVVALGGALGAMARYWVGGWAQQKWGPSFPYGTFLINASGSFLLGLFATLTLRMAWSEPWRLLIAIGFLGAYTTFSTFSYESLQLIAEGRRYGAAAVNLAGSVILGLGAAYAGVLTARVLFTLQHKN